MDNLQAALDAPTALNVTVQATRRREVRRSSRPREYLTERVIEKLMDAAPLVRLQAGQRWAGHSIDPTLSWPQVDCFDGSLHGARAGSVQGFLERLRKAHQRMR